MKDVGKKMGKMTVAGAVGFGAYYGVKNGLEKPVVGEVIRSLQDNICGSNGTTNLECDNIVDDTVHGLLLASRDRKEMDCDSLEDDGERATCADIDSARRKADYRSWNDYDYATSAIVPAVVASGISSWIGGKFKGAYNKLCKKRHRHNGGDDLGVSVMGREETESSEEVIEQEPVVQDIHSGLSVSEQTSLLDGVSVATQASPEIGSAEAQASPETNSLGTQTSKDDIPVTWRERIKDTVGALQGYAGTGVGSAYLVRANAVLAPAVNAVFKDTTGMGR